jgi:hypothetical protein
MDKNTFTLRPITMKLQNTGDIEKFVSHLRNLTYSLHICLNSEEKPAEILIIVPR